MPHAIAVRSSDPSAAAIRALWREAAAFEARPSMEPLGYAPHVTLGVYGTDEDAALADFVESVALPAGGLRLRFGKLSWFDGPPLVLWAAPDENADLRRLHRALHARLDPMRCHAHYRPDAWVPHCTLAMAVGESRRGAALAFAARPRAPVEVLFDSLDCVSFPPVRLLRRRALPV